MKKLSVLLIFMLTVMFSSTALAADWVEFHPTDWLTLWVDRSSIKRGVKSRVYNIDSKEGYSAHCKTSFKVDDKLVGGLGLCWFFKEDGKKKYAFLDHLESYENGKKVPTQKNLPLYDSWTVHHDWETVWDFVERNAR